MTHAYCLVVLVGEELAGFTRFRGKDTDAGQDAEDTRDLLVGEVSERLIDAGVVIPALTAFVMPGDRERLLERHGKRMLDYVEGLITEAAEAEKELREVWG